MKIWVRGVYYNGLRGLATLRENAEKAVVFVKGIARGALQKFSGRRRPLYKMAVGYENLCGFG